MRGLGKKMHPREQTDRQTDRPTWRLYDQLAPEGPSWWKFIKGTKVHALVIDIVDAYIDIDVIVSFPMFNVWF